MNDFYKDIRRIHRLHMLKDAIILIVQIVCGILVYYFLIHKP